MLKLLPGAVAALTLCLNAPALAAGPYEPNDSIVTATTLAGAQDYNAAIETPTDQDLFALYIVGSQEVDVTVTNVEAASGNAACGEPVVWGELDAPGGTPVATVHDNSTVLLPSTSWDIVRTLRTGRYILRVIGGCGNVGLGTSGAAFSVRVEPAQAVSTADCYSADRLLILARRAYAHAKRRHSRAHRPATRRRLARVVRAKRRALRDAQAHYGSACP